ncbi:MAG TPA: hypothetical protein DEA96_10100 [Leptospiraceae bacterium]|nr:hypothetical protein [Spirochaetaceae bacterium]HBS05308.1 hypothetical protein [Leptospiraceae bacterium]
MLDFRLNSWRKEYHQSKVYRGAGLQNAEGSRCWDAGQGACRETRTERTDTLGLEIEIQRNGNQ